jgi:hypothetical protein
MGSLYKNLLPSQINKLLNDKNDFDDFRNRHFKEIINCEKCIDPNQIYNPKTKKCIDKTSVKAYKLMESIIFCEKYFKQKLNKDESGILNALLEVPLNYKNYKIKDLLPKGPIPYTKKILAVVLTLTGTFIIQINPFAKVVLDLINHLSPLYPNNFILMRLKSFIIDKPIINGIYKFFNGSIRFTQVIIEYFFGQKRNDVDLIEESINRNVDVYLVPRHREYKEIHIPITDIKNHNINNIIEDVLVENKVLIKNGTKSYINLARLGLNSNDLYNEKTKLFFNYHGDTLNIKLTPENDIFHDEYIVFYKKGRNYILAYNNEFNTKTRYKDKLLRELAELQEKLEKENEKIQKLLETRIDDIRNKRKIISELKKNNKSYNKYTTELNNLELFEVNIDANEKIFLKHTESNYYQFLKKDGLLHKVKSRINDIRSQNVNSEFTFFVKWIKMINDNLKLRVYEKSAIEDLNKIVLYEKNNIEKIARKQTDEKLPGILEFAAGELSKRKEQNQTQQSTSQFVMLNVDNKGSVFHGNVDQSIKTLQTAGQQAENKKLTTFDKQMTNLLKNENEIQFIKPKKSSSNGSKKSSPIKQITPIKVTSPLNSSEEKIYKDYKQKNVNVTISAFKKLVRDTNKKYYVPTKSFIPNNIFRNGGDLNQKRKKSI